MRYAVSTAALVFLLLVVPDPGLAESCHRMPPAETESATEKISEFGKYDGYSKAIYDSWVRSSVYVSVRDGDKLAADIMLPAIDCEPAKDPLPVLWTYTPYQRAYLQPDGTILTAIEDQGAQRLVRHGYIIAAVAIRGTAASFGRYRGLFSPTETNEAYDITEWLAKQPWSDGKIGMIGGSYQGITQLMLASLNPPHLKAIFPDVSLFDSYESVHPGGIFRNVMWDYWAQLRHNLDMNMLPVPVDDDKSGALLAKAKAQHFNNWQVMRNLRAAAFRDYDQPEFSWIKNNPAARLDAINRAKIPMYISDGWHDIFTPDVLFWYANYAGPKKMMIGPWTHNSKHDPKVVVNERDHLTTTEELRWFDYWLKGIDNGIMTEEPVNYTVLTGPDMEHVWRESATWPPPDIEPQRLYFQSDAMLGDGQPQSESSFDDYRLDYTTTTGPDSRWNIFYGLQKYPDMTVNDNKSLTYTSAPLASDLEIIGFPVVTLYVSSTANDGDFHVLLERVDGSGFSHYVTEGLLRASQRKLREAPWENFGLPYQSHSMADVRTLVQGEVVELKFYLMPEAIVFHKGDRIRVAIMCADADNTENLVFETTPTIKLFRDRRYGSNIVLPIKR